MKYIKEYKSFNQEYYALYVYPTFLLKNKIYLFSEYPNDFKKEWLGIIEQINSKYDFIIPLDSNKIQPGCVLISSDSEMESLSKDLYNKLSNIKLHGEKIGIIITYGKGEIDYLDNKTIHNCSGEVLIRVGHFLDKTRIPGMYNLDK